MKTYFVEGLLALAACTSGDFEHDNQAMHAAGERLSGGTALHEDWDVRQALERHTSGLVLRVTNAMDYKPGENGEPTRCHLSASFALCCRIPTPSTPTA